MTNYARQNTYNHAMDIIYIDRLFALNLILDYLLLLCTARLCGVPLRRRRYALAAFIGAMYAALGMLRGAQWLYLPPVKLVCGFLMALVSFGCEQKLLRCGLVFFVVSALFGGAVWAISMQNGAFFPRSAFIPVSLPVLCVSFAVIYAVLSFVFRRSVKSADICVYDAQVRFMGNTVLLRCLEDSGNSLFDPISGSEVLISSATALAPLFPDTQELLKSSDPTGLMLSPRLSGRLRLIPYSAVGTESGMLPVFRPDELRFDGRLRDDVVIAVSPTPIGGDGFDSII